MGETRTVKTFALILAAAAVSFSGVAKADTILVKGKAAMSDGTIDGGIWTSGMVQGLIDSYPSCAEIINDIVADCEATIRERLNSFVAG